MAAVGLIFAPLAPLVAAMACVVFWGESLVVANNPSMLMTMQSAAWSINTNLCSFLLRTWNRVA